MRIDKTTVAALVLALAGCMSGGVSAKDVDVMAVYYPHWHNYPKANEWFKPGWTEWEFVKDAAVRFPGHQQIKPLPGYLDGKDPVDVETEIELAANAGIDVFLWDFYYYNGEITQQESIEQGFLKAKNRNKMKFALMWCYHERYNQFRPDPTAKRVPLMSLAHTPEEFLGLIDYAIAHYFNQPEYYRKDGRLFFSIFNLPYLWKTWGEDDAKVRRAIDEARRRVRVAGLGELHVNGQNADDRLAARAKELGFDSLTDYGFGPWKLPDYGRRYAAGERLFDYGEIDGPLQRHWAARRDASLPYFPIVPMGWNVMPRCRNDVSFPWAKDYQYPYCASFTNNAPATFEKYLRDAKAAVLNDPKKPGIVYINAWNEYTEGSYLLPTVRQSDAYLRAIARTFGRTPADKFVFCPMRHWWNPKAPNSRAQTIDAPTHEDVAYGPHLRQRMDAWLPAANATDGKPTPVVMLFHGGGWCDGDRMERALFGLLPKCRAAGVALVTVEYRMVHDANDAGIKPPVKASLDDAVAAIRLVQSKAKEWNIDPTRVGLTGGSAGACSSLYASLAGDNALGIRAVLANVPQTSIDPKEMREWIPNSHYGAHAFGYPNFETWLAHRAECLPWIEKFSPAALLRAATPARAPTFFYTCPPLPKAGELPSDPTHAAMFCVKFEEICRQKGVSCQRGSIDDLIQTLKR